MQQILNVITPSPTQDLVSLDDMKQKLFIASSDTTKDFLLQEIITNTSETIAKLCNRVFGYEEVDETFYQLEDGSSQRLYLSRWPVLLTDIKTFTQDGNDLLAAPNWVLEQATGTIYLQSSLGSWYGVIDVDYSGGYQLPDGAPGSLKFATEALIREGYMSWIRSPASFGVRQISHKEARIGYFGPNLFPTTGLPATWQTVQSILNRYIRHWV
ncbi:MAG TPA: hypothetical protein VGH47_04495 [Xanthobacteraceae bacterium]